VTLGLRDRSVDQSLAAPVCVGRTAAIAEVTLILTGWSLAEYPRLITPESPFLTPLARRFATVADLCARSRRIVLFPSLFFLFRVFKGKEVEAHRSFSAQAPFTCEFETCNGGRTGIQIFL